MHTPIYTIKQISVASECSVSWIGRLVVENNLGIKTGKGRTCPRVFIDLDELRQLEELMGYLFVDHLVNSHQSPRQPVAVAN